MPPSNSYTRRMPTAKTKELAKARGWMIDTAESFNAYSGHTKDLFGFIDLVALDGHHIIAIQTTSGANASARVKKIMEDCEPAAKKWLKGGGRILVIAWRKVKNKLQYREIEIRMFHDELGWEELK